MNGFSHKTPGKSVLLINMFFFPDIAPTAQLAVDLARDLIEKDYSVSVVSGRGSYLNSDSPDSLPLFELIDGIKVYRVVSTSFMKRKKWGRMLNYLTFCFFAFLKVMSLPRHDVVITMSTPPFISFLGIILKRVKGSRFICWVQDVYPEVAIAFGAIGEKGIFARFLKRLSLSKYREADRVLVIGERMFEKIREMGLDNGNFEIIHNWADPVDFELRPGEKNPIQEDLGLQDKFVVLYSGNMGVVHDFKIIKSAIRELKEDEDIIFLFVGNGVKRNDLELFVRENGIENIRFLPYQPRDKMKYTMNSGHLLLVTLDEKAAGLVVPSKMYAAMAAKRPILGVGSKESELWDIVSGNGCGIMVENEDSAGLVKGIRQFKENNGVYDECADKSAELFSKYFTRKIATEKFSGVLDNLTSRH